MSAFIVVVVVGACTWVVFRAATQPVEPATAGFGATRARAPRPTRPPKRRPEPPPVPTAVPVPTTPPVEAEAPVALAPAPPVLPPPPVLAPWPDLTDDRPGDDPTTEDPGDDAESRDDASEEAGAVATLAPPRRRRGPRSDPGEPARRPTLLERARSGVLLMGLAVVLGTAVAIGIGIGALVLFNVLRSALG